MSDDGFTLSRRRFLAWVSAGAAAGVGGWGGLSAATGRGRAATAAVDALLSAPFRGPDREIRTLHFALGTAEHFHTDLRLCVGGTMVPLVRHDERSRRRLALRNPVAARTDLSQFTHAAVQINVPATRPLEVNVWGTDRETGEEVPVGGVILCPTWAIRRMALAAQQLGVLQSRYAEDRLVRALGIAAEDAPSTPREALALADLAEIATTSAQKFVFKHPSIMNFDATTSAVTSQIITGTPLSDGLITAIQTFLTNVGVYGQPVAMVNATGPQTIPSGPNGTNPVPGFSFQPFVKDGTKYKNVDIPTAWTSDLRQTAAQTISAVINLVQDTIALENKSWVLATGTPPTTQPVNSAQSGAVRAAAVEQDPQDPAATTTTTTTPPAPPPQFSVDSNWHSGTKLELQGVTVQNGEAVVTVRVFNNNEKVYDIYAQYYNADGVQVDQFGNPPTKGTSPDLAVSLGPSLYACPTIVGIPVFDTNYVDYEVPIPSSVTTTNIMLATMGGKSGWQQYLVDANNNQLYPGLVFPQECKMAVIMTTVMNLAIPTILLVLDVVAFAQMFKSVFNAAGNVSRVALQDDVSAFFSGLKGLFPAVGGLADAISGFATASDYGTPDKPSIITVLVDLGLLIIGLISIPALVRVLALIYAGAATEEPVKAIPIVGEVFAAISAAADVAVLGQTAGEVGNDTWVSVRALTGTYDTVVTVMPEGAAFPPSATYWELIPELGMTDSQKAITDPNFQSNGPQVGPLKIPVPSVPFGNTITYKITFKEGPAGNPTWIVGSGSTNALPNSDPANLPEPTINITNVAPPVSTGSTFDRKFTSQFDTTASAYSWSTVATVPGTIADQQTCDTPQTVCQAGSIAVGALTGFVGYTYQSEQGWFVRQVGYPDAASGARGIATPFEAEPLLLYDSSGLDAASGQNFLLDPIVGANAYHVRQLNLTVDGLGFDRTTSWGVFFDTIHAVAVHPAGLLVGLNTDTGILHILQLPDAGMDELLAPAATMHAGKGNASGLRPGLTQSPVSVGVALNGMVLVLEQGANRIQAFDVRGNPTQYFTANGVANSSYYLPLVSQDTYLGMSLDGAGFIYTLSYSGDGSDPSQYGLDIYNATGVHIARSSGVNAATFVVDPWRNAYTQNFVALQESSGGAHVTPQGVAEPSTSVWALNTPYIPG